MPFPLPVEIDFQAIMEYGSTPYIGMALKKNEVAREPVNPMVEFRRTG